jgi:hypothetical protein
MTRALASQLDLGGSPSVDVRERLARHGADVVEAFEERLAIIAEGRRETDYDVRMAYERTCREFGIKQ